MNYVSGPFQKAGFNSLLLSVLSSLFLLLLVPKMGMNIEKDKFPKHR